MKKKFFLSFCRKITKDYTDSQHRVLSRQSSLDRNANPVCPICVDVEILPDLPVSSGPVTTGSFRQQACSECDKIVCKDCGSFELSTKTKVSSVFRLKYFGQFFYWQVEQFISYSTTSCFFPHHPNDWRVFSKCNKICPPTITNRLTTRICMIFMSK